MKNKKLLPVILIVLSVVLAAVSLIVLPKTVVIQFSVGTGANTTAPKALAVLIPSVLGIAGAVLSLLLRADNKAYVKSLVVSAVGNVAFLIMIAVNTAGV